MPNQQQHQTRRARQSRAHRRREQAVRAARCRGVAISRGYRHVCPLLDVLADYGTISDALPYPSQETIAEQAGVTDRTVRNWLTVLETLGLVVVFRSQPKRQTDGTYSRATNRYLIADKKAQTASHTSPVRRRHRTNTAFSPTGNQFPVTATWLEPDGPDLASAGPKQPFDEQSLAMNPRKNDVEGVSEDEAVAPPDAVKASLAAARAALRPMR